MKLALVFMLIGLGISLHARAQSCVCDTYDPFDPREDALMPAGPYQGLCEDSCTMRSAHILNSEEITQFFPFSDNHSNFFIANVQHRDRFYFAVIPYNFSAKPQVSGIDTAIVQLERVPPEAIAGHTQLRLHFSSDILLIPQSSHDFVPTEKIRDLIFSDQSIGPPNVQFNLVKGLTDFALVYRVTTLEQRYREMVLQNHHHVEQYKLNFKQDELSLVLRTVLNFSSNYGLHTMYNTLDRSCVTEMLRAIDLSVDYEKRGVQRHYALEAESDRLPVLITESLKDRGLLSKGFRLQDFNNEPPSP